jgi:hypothetical protein
MAIRRGAVPADNFTIISNAWLRDPRLTWKAKGLLVYIASHAAGHQLTTAQIHAAAKDGPDSVRAAIAELEAAGYLLRIELRDGRGHRTGTDYELREPPAGEAPPRESQTGSDQGEEDVSAAQSQSGKSRVGKSGSKKTTPPEDQEKTPSASPRGTRLPEGWQPDEELVEWCRTELVPEQRWSEHSRDFVRREHDKFTDWCRATPGQKAVKKDWRAAWRNWMRRAFEHYAPNRPVSGPPAQGQYRTAAQQNAEDARRRLERAKLAEDIREARGITMEEAYRLAGEQMANGLDTCTPKGYIDGEIIAPKAREVTEG